MGTLVYDIERLYEQIFGKSKKYHLDGAAENELKPLNGGYKLDVKKVTPELPATYKTTDLHGVDIWLPTWLEALPPNIGTDGTIFLPYCTMRFTGSSTIVRTPLAERRGTVKELFNTDDYKITLKGFFIDKAKRTYPDADLRELRKLHELGQSFKIRNYLTDLFLIDKTVSDQEQNRVVFTGFDLPENEGGRLHVKPFIFNLESDGVFTLTVE